MSQLNKFFKMSWKEDKEARKPSFKVAGPF